MTTAQALATPLPRPLPHCSYPRAADVASHGIQALPDVLPLATLSAAMPYRSRVHRAVSADRLPSPALLELARVVAASFARREPQCRHVRPPSEPPAALAGTRHGDAFGSEPFGPWSSERLMYWFVRLLLLTDPTSPSAATNDAAVAQSIAILDDAGRVIGGAINDVLPPHGATPPLRAGDPFLDAVLTFIAPVLDLLTTQDDAAIAALARYPDFAAAHAAGRVGHHIMVARADALPTLDAFELVAATAERYRALDFPYVIVEATNQWTGAACEALGAVRVHFAPFRARRSVAASVTPLANEPSSRDGYLSAKDSGSMLYVLRLT